MSDLGGFRVKSFVKFSPASSSSTNIESQIAIEKNGEEKGHYFRQHYKRVAS